MSQFAWTFPGGKKQIQKSPAPVAGNVATTITVPAGKIWLLLNIKMILTTDVTVVNRNCVITMQDIVDVSKFYNKGQTIAASDTQNTFFIFGGVLVGEIVSALGYNLMVAGEDVVLSIFRFL